MKLISFKRILGNLLFILNGIVTLPLAAQTVVQPIDVSFLLQNPDFEYASADTLADGLTVRGLPYGWNHTPSDKLVPKDSQGTPAWGITSGGQSSGKNLCWYNSVPMPYGFMLYQEIKGIPEGTYVVTCDLSAMGNDATMKTTQRLFANNVVQYYGVENDYSQAQLIKDETATFAGHPWDSDNWGNGFTLKPMSVTVKIAKGENLVLGIKSGPVLYNGTMANNAAGFFKVDNFKLKCIEADEAEMAKFAKNDLKQIIDSVSSYISDTEGWLWSSQELSVLYGDLKEKLEFAINEYDNVSATIESVREVKNILEMAWTAYNSALSQNKIRIACIGNSITEGMGIVNPIINSYPAQLGQLLGPGYEVGNFGVSGRTLLKYGDLPYWNEQAFVKSQEFCPDIVIIKLGTNDTKPFNWKYGNEFEGNLQELVDIYKNLPSSPKIYLAYPAKVFYNTFDIHDNVITDEIMPVIAKVAERNGLDIIDFHSAYEDKQYFMTADGVHPNEKGASMMAELVKSDIVVKMLENSGFENIESEETKLPEGWNIENAYDINIQTDDGKNHYLCASSKDSAMLSISQNVANIPIGKYKLNVHLRTDSLSKVRLYIMLDGRRIESDIISTEGEWTDINMEFEVNSYLTSAQIGVECIGSLEIDDFNLNTVQQRLLDIYNSIISDSRLILEDMADNASGGLKEHMHEILLKTDSLSQDADTLAMAINLLQNTIKEYEKIVSDYNYVISIINGLQLQLSSIDASVEKIDACMAALKQEEESVSKADTQEDIHNILCNVISIFEECLSDAKIKEDRVLDMTFFIKNSQVSSADNWINPSTASGYPYVGAPDNLYLDRWNALLDTYQDIILPAGIYRLRAATRASQQISNCYLYATSSGRTYKRPVVAIGSTGGALGNGWNWSDINNIMINKDDNQMRVGFYANAVNFHWASVDVFTLEMTRSLYQDVDGINNLLPNKELVDVYSLGGILLKKGVTLENAYSTLPEGCYIINGKCMVIP